MTKVMIIIIHCVYSVSLPQLVIIPSIVPLYVPRINTISNAQIDDYIGIYFCKYKKIIIYIYIYK